MIGNHFESPTAKGWRSEMVLYTVKAAGAAGIRHEVGFFRLPVWESMNFQGIRQLQNSSDSHKTAPTARDRSNSFESRLRLPNRLHPQL